MKHLLTVEATLTLPSATSASRAYTSSVAASACTLTHRTGRQNQQSRITRRQPQRTRRAGQLTRSSTSTTRHTTCGGTRTAAPAGTSPPSPSPARCACGRYTTALPRRGSTNPAPAHACHSSPHTAPAGLSSSTALRSIPICPRVPPLGSVGVSLPARAAR
jgi:hypothetical protein